jgi:hypothetical protein
MASAHRTILIILALAVPLVAQSAPEDPPPAIVEGSVINIQNSRTVPRATVTLLRVKGPGSKSQPLRWQRALHFQERRTRNLPADGAAPGIFF